MVNCKEHFIPCGSPGLKGRLEEKPRRLQDKRASRETWAAESLLTKPSPNRWGPLVTPVSFGLWWGSGLESLGARKRRQ
jgi:hypothetical protein